MAADNTLARKTMIGATWLVVWRMFTRVLGLISTLVLARVLVPADFGLVAMAITFLATVEAVSALGLQEALVRRPEDDRALFDAAFTLQAGRAALTGLALALGAETAAVWFNEPRVAPVLYVLAAVTVLAGLENIGIVEFRRQMRFDIQFRLLSIPRLLQVAVTIPLAFALQSYWALLIGIAVGRLSRTVMTYMVHPYRPRFGLHGWRELAGFSFWTWAAVMASIVWERSEVFVLGPSIGTATLGVYLLALELAILPVSELIAPAADALFAGFASAQKEGRSSTRIAPSVACALLLCIMPLIITISCASGYVVAALLGPKWVEAQPLIEILVWLCVFAPFSWVCTTVLVANNHVRLNFVVRLAMSAVKLAVILATVSVTRRLDHIAYAIVACNAVEAMLFLAALKRAEPLRLLDMAGGLMRIALATAATLLVLAQTGLAWQPVSLPSWTALLHGALIGGGVLTVFALALAVLWLLAGRPAGPEAKLYELGRQWLGHMLAKRLAPKRAG